MSAPRTPDGAPAEAHSVESEPIEDFRAGGVSWTARAPIRQEIEAAFGLTGPPEFERMPGCEAIKATPRRAVWRLPLGGRSVYIKRYRVRGQRERAKYLFARPRARAEWRTALRLREAGIETVNPLAVGITRKGPFLGDTWFIADELPGERLDSALERARQENRELGPLLRAVVGLHEQLLASGFVHPDLHAGNLLIRFEADVPSIGLVDLHAIRRPARAPSRSATERVRAKLAHSLWLVLGESEFDQALAILAPGEAAKVRRSLDTIERTRLRSRSKRCLRVSTSFVRDRSAGWILWRRRSVDLDSLLALAHADEWRPQPSTQHQLRVEGRLRSVEVRRFAPLQSTSIRVWKGAQALAVRGIPGRAALAHLRRLRFGIPWESILVTELLSGAVRLDQVDRAQTSEQLMQTALDTAKLHHRFGLSAKPEDLFALRIADTWRVVRGDLVVAPRDRPLDVDRSLQELELIRARTAPLADPKSQSAHSKRAPGASSGAATDTEGR